MEFMKQTVSEALPIWDDCMQSSFVQELKEGTLSEMKFKKYMIQDSIYLKYYAKVFAKAMYHAETLADMQVFYSVLCCVTDSESVVRLNYLKSYHMTDADIEHIKPLAQNRRYIEFMMETAKKANINEMLMAVLPCMLSYSYIFAKIQKEISANNHYEDFISDYADKEYAKECENWTTFADEKCKDCTPCEQEKLKEIFKQASYLELDFWNMSYQEGDD